MCWSCGCGALEADHGDPRALTTLALSGAGNFSGIDIPQVVGNIVASLGHFNPALVKARDVAVLQDGEHSIAGAVLKADDSKRYLLTVAYPAWKQDVAVAADGHIDVAPADVVEQACWNFARKGSQLGMWHRDGFADCGEVVENYIWRGPQWAMKASDGTSQLVMPDDWLVGMVLTEPTWALYKSGAIGGVSPQGSAARRAPTPETLERMRSRLNA